MFCSNPSLTSRKIEPFFDGRVPVSRAATLGFEAISEHIDFFAFQTSNLPFPQDLGFTIDMVNISAQVLFTCAIVRAKDLNFFEIARGATSTTPGCGLASTNDFIH